MRLLPKPVGRLAPLLATALLVAACQGGAEPGPAAARPVRTAQAVTGPGTPAVRTSGVIVARDELRLAFKQGGVIRRIAVRDGDRVRKGQTLAEIELTEIDAQLEEARELAAKAQRDLARGDSLRAEGVISQTLHDDLATQAALAEARLRSAHFNRNLSVIEAPLDGVVLHRLAEEREQVAAGQTVLVVGAHSRGHVLRVALADRDIVRVAPGDPAAVHIDAFPGQRWPARVSEVAGAAEPSSGLFTAELVLAEAPPRLVSGLVARVEIQPAASRPLVHVPIAALVAGDRDTASVYVPAPPAAAPRSRA